MVNDTENDTINDTENDTINDTENDTVERYSNIEANEEHSYFLNTKVK